jgi:hypothetical protein
MATSLTQSAYTCLACPLTQSAPTCYVSGFITNCLYLLSPAYSYLEGKAFRHGDLCDTLGEIAKGSGGAAGILGAVTGGLLAKKFGGLDIKRIYFGEYNVHSAVYGAQTL